ncbi:prolyl endopeptidase-like [Zophobas morio]|uniref:prolyl endopeptidase-like n=1 Tax=Zophobas morio TaxID=2755281 RepID=UPI0030831285
MAKSKACLELNQNRILHEAVVFIDTEDLTNRLNSKDPLVVHYLKVSGDQTHLVYGFGPEHTIFGINVVDVREKPSTICFIKGAYDAELGGKVSTGNLCLFYTILTSSGRPYRLYKKFLHKLPLQKEPFLHRLWNFCYAFNVPTEDELLFEEKDNRFFLNISRTKNGHLVLLGSHSKTSSEVWLVDAHTSSQPTEIHTHSRSKIQLLCSRNSKIKYYVEHVSSDIPENSFYLLICQKTEATDLEIVKAYHLGSDHTLGEKLFNSNSETKIEEVDVFNTYCVIYGKLKRTGDASVKVLHYDGRKVDDVELPVAYCTVAPCPSLDYTAETFKFTLSSPILPPLLLEYDTVKKVYKTLKTSEATSGLIFRLFSLDLTSCEIKSITVRHGDVLIPVTLIHSQSVIENGKNPLICYGYGAYGECLKRDFVLERIPLLADGWLLALCHVRGGGELGTHWHEQGKLMLKKNSVDDFKACIEWLQTERPYSSPQLTVIHGSSAGGLLVGAIYNKQPKMFSCAIMRAPFLDVLTEMLDPNLFLTEHERDEWGDPLTNKEVYDYIKSYSPLETLERFSQSPPNLLITTNLYDSVVPFSHSAKYIIKLRNCMEKKNYKSEAFPLILLNVIENSVQLQGKGLNKYHEWSTPFMLKVLSMTSTNFLAIAN